MAPDAEKCQELTLIPTVNGENNESCPHETEASVKKTSNRNNSLETANKSFKKLLENVTLEPMLFLKMVADGNSFIVGSALQTDLICQVNLNNTEEDCGMMDDGNHTEIQTAVQIYQNTFQYYQKLMASILPVIVILFAGSLSDKYGRKLPMVIVLTGYVVYSLVHIVVAVYPTQPVEVLYAASLAIDLTGTWAVFNMAVYSYVADITPIETRTKRMGWLDAIWYSGGPIGTWMGGWLYQCYGYVTVFTVSSVMWIICLVYVIFVVKESIVKEESKPKESCSRSVFNMVKATFKRYPNHGRLHLMTTLALKLGLIFIQGHQVYLWARRVLNWDASNFSYWSGTNEALHQIGMMVWVGLASSYHFSDFTTALTGLVSMGLWLLVLACITSPTLWWLTIIATLLGMLEACTGPALRTLITTIPDKKDIGKIFALLGLLESVALIVDQSVYTYLYNAFVESFPQINYVVGSTIAVILILVLKVLERDWKKRRDVPLTTPSQI